MGTATVSLYDVLRRMMPETEAREAEVAFLTAARQEAKTVQRETVQKELPKLVETAFATELRHLATKADAATIRGEMKDLATKDDLRALLYWTIGGFITMLVSIIAILLVLLQVQTTAGMPQ